jgi:hypothetical protein
MIDCECGRKGLNASQMVMHNRSKQHRAWAEGTPIESLAVLAVAMLDPKYKEILDIASTGESPFHIAKLVRGLFKARGWPNDEHPGTVRDWLTEHNIPIIDVPRHQDADEQRQFVASELDRIQKEGWGRTWEVIYG